MDQWLVRTAQNLIVGPYSRDQVCGLIREGQLGLLDEICPANGYWIMLSERSEVLRQLGVEVKAVPVTSEEEPTATQTTQTDLAASVARSDAAGLASADLEPISRSSMDPSMKWAVIAGIVLMAIALLQMFRH